MAKNNRSRVQLVDVVTGLAAQRLLWEPLVKFDPVSRQYARLAAEREFEAWLLTWVPGKVQTGTTTAAVPAPSLPSSAR
jgi:hypothetical protein